jgi:hypothetical protein
MSTEQQTQRVICEYGYSPDKEERARSEDTRDVTEVTAVRPFAPAYVPQNLSLDKKYLTEDTWRAARLCGRCGHEMHEQHDTLSCRMTNHVDGSKLPPRSQSMFQCRVL